MLRQRFDEYISRFNREDGAAFDEFLAEDVVVLNGALTLEGRRAMTDHYERLIWPHFEETVTVLRFVSDRPTAAVQLWTRFKARRESDTLFGAVQAGELFDYRGVIMYEINSAQRFSKITVAYNSFVNTKPNGTARNLGIPH